MDKSGTRSKNHKKSRITQMNPMIEESFMGAAVLAGLVLLLPMAKQSKEFVRCIKNAETGIVNLTGADFLDEDGKSSFIERNVAVRY